MRITAVHETGACLKFLAMSLPFIENQFLPISKAFYLSSMRKVSSSVSYFATLIFVLLIGCFKKKFLNLMVFYLYIYIHINI